MSLGRGETLRKARNYAAEAAVGSKQRLYIADDMISRLAQVVVDALDCRRRGEPFHSDELVRLSNDIDGDCGIISIGSKLAKFTYGMTVLMREMEGSIIGAKAASMNPRPVKRKAWESIIVQRGMQREQQDLNGFLLPTPPSFDDGPVFIDEDAIKKEPVDTEAEIKIEPADDATDTSFSCIEATVKEEMTDVFNDQYPSTSQQPTEDLFRNDVFSEDHDFEIQDELIGTSMQYGSTRSISGDLEIPAGDVLCVHCKPPSKVVDLDVHVEQFHSKIWLEEPHGCSVEECDFRSIIPSVLRDHEANFVGHSSWYKELCAFPMGNRECPFCEYRMPTIGAYLYHAARHADMMTSQAIIHICGSCGYKSARMYQMIEHWSESKQCNNPCKLRFDYPAAAAAIQQLHRCLVHEKPKFIRQLNPIVRAAARVSPPTTVAPTAPTLTTTERAHKILRNKGEAAVLPAAPQQLTVAIVHTSDPIFAKLRFIFKETLEAVKCKCCEEMHAPGDDMDEHIEIAHPKLFKQPRLAFRCASCKFKTMYEFCFQMHKKEFLCTICGEQTSSCMRSQHRINHQKKKRASVYSAVPPVLREQVDKSRRVRYDPPNFQN